MLISTPIHKAVDYNEFFKYQLGEQLCTNTPHVFQVEMECKWPLPRRFDVNTRGVFVSQFFNSVVA